MKTFVLASSLLFLFGCATGQTQKGELPKSNIAASSTGDERSVTRPQPEDRRFWKMENFYMHINGTTQGDFTGGATRPGREGWSECISYGYYMEGEITHLIIKGAHMMLGVSKKVDTASPQFLKARKKKEILTVVLEFATATEEGKEDVFQGIKLINAKVDAVVGNRNFERVDFTAERIEFYHKKGSRLWWNPSMTHSEQDVCRAPKKLKNFCQ
jgi:type VI secretion system Hcp family effector